MKILTYIFGIYCFISCHTATHSPKTIQQDARIYDTSDLDIQVVHNPKVPRVYGIQLCGKGANWDKCCPVKIEKVVFGDILKVYSDTCEREQRDTYDNLDRCVCIHTEEPFFYSKFKLEIDPQKPIPPNTKCLVYYTAQTIKKMNYVDTIRMIDCFIKNIPGAYDEERHNQCIWEIGADK